jgi:hypothetical protein
VVTLQGTGRRTRARRWVKAMNRGRVAKHVPPVSLTELRGLTHNFSVAHDRHDLGRVIAEKMGILALEDRLDV